MAMNPPKREDALTDDGFLSYLKIGFPDSVEWATEKLKGAPLAKELARQAICYALTRPNTGTPKAEYERLAALIANPGGNMTPPRIYPSTVLFCATHATDLHDALLERLKF